MTVKGSATAPASTLVNGSIRKEKGLQMQHLLVRFFPESPPILQHQMVQRGGWLQVKVIFDSGFDSSGTCLPTGTQSNASKNQWEAQGLFFPHLVSKQNANRTMLRKHKGFTLLWEATEHQVQPSFSQKSFQSLVMDGSTFKWCFYSLVEIKVSYDCQWHTLPDFCLLPEILVHVFLLSLSHF